MPTKSEHVSDADIQAMLNQVEQLKLVRNEISLAEGAGIKLNYTTKDIDNQISSLEQIIRTYILK